MAGREFLIGSRFNVSAGGEAGAPAIGTWGRFTTGGFDAEVEGLSLGGKVTRGFRGADIASGRWLGGVALGVSGGEGTFRLTNATRCGDVNNGRRSRTCPARATGPRAGLPHSPASSAK